MKRWRSRDDFLKVHHRQILNILCLLLAIHPTPTLQMSSNALNSPPCHRGIMSLFHWCEQSDCADKCNCRSKNVCKQICGQDECNLLNCSSTTTCHQSVLLNDYLVGPPHVKKMVSYSPITQQECTQGKCELMKAERAGTKFTRTFQSCSEGECGHLYSKADHTKQFCSNCRKMTCGGPHAKNCTQMCVLGKCDNMHCNARHCEQLCAHDSTCNLTCGPNVETCHQTCSHGSTCTLNSSAKSTSQTCTEEKHCTRNLLRTTPRVTTTPVHTSRAPHTKSVPAPTRVSTTRPTTGKIPSTVTPLVRNVNERTHVPQVMVVDTNSASASITLLPSTNCLILGIVSILYLIL